MYSIEKIVIEKTSNQERKDFKVDDKLGSDSRTIEHKFRIISK